MNAITNSPFRKYQHPALLGLSEKALTALFNAGGVRMLQAQEWLFRSGEAATTGFLIFEGNVSCYRQQEPAQVAMQLLAGDYLPASLLQWEGSYTFDCKANQALTVLQLDTSAVQQMDEASQLTLHKNLMPTFTRLFTQLAQTSPSQGAAPAADATAVAAALLARQAPYLSAISLQTMLANLPKLPPYSTKITSLMSDPNANTRTIVEIARQDPSLTASVLSTVNSAWFGLTHKIKDFQHAVMMLGFNQMQQLLINTGVQSTMPNTPEFRQLQAHSMMISVLCSEISLTLKAGSAQMLSTLGILHDIGKSVVLLLRRQNPKQDFLMSLLDPDIVGMMLLREWLIPDNISAALQYQSWPELVPPDSIPQLHRDNIAVLHLAHCSFERLRNMQAPAPNPNQARPWLARLGCRDQTLDHFLLGRLLPSIKSRSAPLPMVLQDLIRKAQQQEAAVQALPDLAL